MKNYYLNDSNREEYYLIPLDATDVILKNKNISLSEHLYLTYPHVAQKLNEIDAITENIECTDNNTIQEDIGLIHSLLIFDFKRRDAIFEYNLPEYLVCVEKDGELIEIETNVTLFALQNNLQKYHTSKKFAQSAITEEYIFQLYNFLTLTENLNPKR